MADLANITRRLFLSRAPAAAAVGALALSSAAVAANPTEQKPSERDLARYYAFIWHEFFELSAEMGVEQHDSWTAHKFGDMDKIRDNLTARPSSRALGILSMLGVSLAQVPSTVDHTI